MRHNFDAPPDGRRTSEPTAGATMNDRAVTTVGQGVVGDIVVRRILESEQPYLPPEEMFFGPTSEKLAPHLDWLLPTALCPRTGNVVMTMQSYLLRTRRHTILIDTCVGNDKSISIYEPWHKRTGGTYLADLAAAGAHPDEVDFVLCTHLHVDHVGWNTRLVDGRWIPTFANAKYIVARREYEAFLAKAEADAEGAAMLEESLAPIFDAGQAVLVDMDHQVDDDVWLEPAPGHTPGHVTVRMTSQNERGVMLGDMIVSPLQCINPDWDFAYDEDRDQARAARHAFLAAHCETDVLVMTAHFPSPSVGHVVSHGEGYRFRYCHESGG